MLLWKERDAAHFIIKVAGSQFALLDKTVV